MLDEHGFVTVDEHLRVSGYHDVHAVGDVAASDPARSSARNFGYRVVVRNVRAAASGRTKLASFTAPKYRWGSIVGLQDNGMVIHQPNGRAIRVPRWAAQRVLMDVLTRTAIYGGVRRERRTLALSRRPGGAASAARCSWTERSRTAGSFARILHFPSSSVDELCMSPSRNVRWVAIALAALVLAALHPSNAAAWAQEPPRCDATTNPARRVAAAAASTPDALSVLIRPVTGVRPGATTVIGGALINTGDAPEAVGVELDGLPDGVTIDAVRPDASAPVDGRFWSCAATTCQLVDADGAEQTLDADSDVGLVLALRGDALPASGGSVRVAVGDRPALTVPLDRAENAPPMDATTLSMSVTGAASVLIGDSVETTVRVSNLAATPTTPGSIVLARAPVLRPRESPSPRRATDGPVTRPAPAPRHRCSDRSTAPRR